MVKTFAAFDGIQTFITVFTSDHRRSYSCTHSAESAYIQTLYSWDKL
jgi:hypothetical protein